MIEQIEALRALYKDPGQRALDKQLAALEPISRRFIALSPFVVLATGDASGLDASPRGGAPGFVHVVDDHTLWIPDSPGNNRLDSLSNLLADPRLGLLFLIPGVDETLRVNGRARLRDEPQVLARMADARREPKVVIELAVREVYLHCAKALMRSRLWSDSARIERDTLPSMGAMIHAQTGDDSPAESQQAMIARYQNDL